MSNLILNVDSYKHSHFAQYPPGAEFVSSYIESRGGEWDETVFFGLQAFIAKYLVGKVMSQADIDEAADICAAHQVPFNREGWEHILKEHDGKLPIEIRAVAEGTVVPTSNVLVQVVNTDPAVPWLTSFVETMLLRAVWYPTTVATLSYHIRKDCEKYLQLTSDDPETKLPFMLNDFGSRGVSSGESAELGGMAHLLSFSGTDNLLAIMAARKFYGADMPGFSVPASEHSTVTSWGREREVDAYRAIVEAFQGDFPLISVVSDSYDIFDACSEIWGGELKQLVMECGSTIVVRPDSGDPVTIVREVVEALMDKFGYTTNSKGFKVLPDCIRVIQGDGINAESIHRILHRMYLKGLSIDNIVFGMGGGLLQEVNRDTLRFAMKANAICIEGEWQDVYKQPKTDSGKASKRGRLALVRNKAGNLMTIRKDKMNGEEDLLRTVFRDGQAFWRFGFEEIRNILYPKED